MSQFDKIKKTLQETPLLNRYLKSRGINPDFATKDQKVAHSKTAQFKTWMMHHVNDNVTEAVDKRDTITMDIPLLIRVLEFAREDLKNDVLLHKMVERLIAIRGKGTLTMNQYGRIIKEEAEALGESYGDRADKLLAYSHSMHQQARQETDPAKKSALSAKGSKAHKVFLKARDRNIAKDPEAHARKMQSGASQDFKDQEAKRGIGHVRDHVEVEGQVVEGVVDTVKKAWKAVSNFDDPTPKYDGNTKRRQDLKDKLAKQKKQKEVSEAKEANYGGDYQSTVLRVKELAKKKPVDMKSLAARMQASYAKDKKPVKESLEPMAACNQPGDGANNPDDTEKSTSKKVKLLLGAKKKVNEDMYDHEKDDKPSASLKRPKVLKLAMDSTKEAPQAAAVLQGGKTLTGEPRDTIEIDPMLKTKKPQKSV